MCHGSISIFLRAQELKVVNYSNFTITFPTIWPPQVDFLNICDHYFLAEDDIGLQSSCYYCFLSHPKKQYRGLVLFYCYLVIFVIIISGVTNELYLFGDLGFLLCHLSWWQSNHILHWNVYTIVKKWQYENDLETNSRSPCHMKWGNDLWFKYTCLCFVLVKC